MDNKHSMYVPYKLVSCLKAVFSGTKIRYSHSDSVTTTLTILIKKTKIRS